jgi:peptide deformylase
MNWVVTKYNKNRKEQMIKLTDALLNTKLEFIKESDYKMAFCEAIQVKQWLNNKNAYAVASNQLGIKHHFIVVKNAKRWGLPTDIFFNAYYEPENVEHQIMNEELCLSYPGQKFIVLRYPKIHLNYYDPRDKMNKECFLDGIGAIAIQHECDHLLGRPDPIVMQELQDKIDEAKKKQETTEPIS